MKPIMAVLESSIVLLIALCLAGPVQAAECSGYDVLVSQLSETTELAKGQTITVVRNHSVLVTENPADKYNLTIGECSGSLVTANGTTTGSGHCARRDTSGDTYSIEWAIAPGAERGTWKAVAGTGKFLRRTDSGWWQNVAGGGKVSAAKWGGTCE